MCRAAIDISLLWSERRDNLRRGIHRGESSPRPAGWGTQPLRIQLRVAHVPIFVPPGSHVAPLGLNAAMSHLTYHAS